MCINVVIEMSVWLPIITGSRPDQEIVSSGVRWLLVKDNHTHGPVHQNDHHQGGGGHPAF